jgi:beta-lactamase class A
VTHRNRIVLALLVLILAVPGSPAVASASGRFVDDDGVPGELYLERLAELDVIHGCDPPANTRVCPTSILTRAEAFKILVGAGQAYEALPPYPATLGDRFVDDNDVWNGALNRFSNFLAAEGIIHGCDPPDNTLICPHDQLSRAHVAKLVVNTFDLTAPTSYRAPWIDTGARWYAESARVAAYHGLFDTSAGRFEGTVKVSRAEFARIVVEAAGEVLCDADPFTAARRASLDTRYPAQTFTAYAYDTRSGCAYWMNPDARLRTASVLKVMVMAGTLLEAHNAGRPLTSWERSRLEPMITRSTNPEVRELWASFGGSPWFRDQARAFGLAETSVVGDDGRSAWGTTTTSAKDQGDLIRQVLLGDRGPLSEQYRAEARDLMTSVVPSQTWGVTSGVPSGWTVAQKNGFAGHITNSVGFVQEPGSMEGYVVVVLSSGWSDWQRGVPVVEEISGWVAAELAR